MTTRSLCAYPYFQYRGAPSPDIISGVRGACVWSNVIGTTAASRLLIHQALLPSAYTCDRVPRPRPHQLRSGNWMNYTPSRAIFALTRLPHRPRITTCHRGGAGEQSYPLRGRNHTCAFSKDTELGAPPSALYHRHCGDTKPCHLYRCHRVIGLRARRRKTVMCRFIVSRKCISIKPVYEALSWYSAIPENVPHKSSKYISAEVLASTTLWLDRNVLLLLLSLMLLSSVYHYMLLYTV